MTLFLSRPDRLTGVLPFIPAWGQVTGEQVKTGETVRRQGYLDIFHDRDISWLIAPLGTQRSMSFPLARA